MIKELKLYRCDICGNVVCMVKDSSVNPVCCGEQMTAIEENITDGAGEKHVPEIRIKGNNVNVLVGKVPHPMTADHYIGWIVLLTSRGIYARCLKPDDYADAAFEIRSDEKVTAAYAWCNIHGLWKQTVNGKEE